MASILTLLLLAADPFAGCQVSGPSAGIDRRIECADATVTTTVDKPAEAGKAGLLELVDELISEAPSTTESSLKELKLGGATRPARMYRTKEVTGFVVLLPVASDRVRIAQCEERKKGACDKLLTALVTLTPPVTKKSSDHPLRFGGATLTVPKNCRNPAPAKLECAGTALTWSHFGVDEEGVYDVSVQALEVGLGRIGAVSRSKLDCFVAGAKTTCALLMITKPDGGELFTVFGVGKIANEQVAAQCNTMTAPVNGLLPPCDQAISFGGLLGPPDGGRSVK